MHLRYTYGNRHRTGLLYTLEKAPLNNTLMSLKGSVVNSEELLRKSLALMSAPKENVELTKAPTLPERKGLRDVTNQPSTGAPKVTKKAMPKKTEPLPPIAELPSILSSPLIVSDGQPVINRTPPSEKALMEHPPVIKPLSKPAKTKKKTKCKQSKKHAPLPKPEPRVLAQVEELRFIVHPEDIGNKIWVRKSA